MYTCVTVPVWMSENNLLNLILSHHMGGLGDETQIIHVGGRCLYPWSHFPSLGYGNTSLASTLFHFWFALRLPPFLPDLLFKVHLSYFSWWFWDGDQALFHRHILGEFHWTASLAPLPMVCSLSHITKLPQGPSCLKMICIPSRFVDSCLGIELKSRNHFPSEFASFSAHTCVSHKIW